MAVHHTGAVTSVSALPCISGLLELHQDCKAPEQQQAHWPASRLLQQLSVLLTEILYGFPFGRRVTQAKKGDVTCPKGFLFRESADSEGF